MSKTEKAILINMKKDLRRTRMKMYRETKDEQLRLRLFELLVRVNQEILKLQSVA